MSGTSLDQQLRAMWQQQLVEAHAIRHKLATGQLEQSVAYNAGEGNRAVTFTRTNLGQLDGYIADLERKLGYRRRRAIGVAFGEGGYWPRRARY